MAEDDVAYLDGLFVECAAGAEFFEWSFDSIFGGG
jgi:hypothetical protein